MQRKAKIEIRLPIGAFIKLLILAICAGGCARGEPDPEKDPLEKMNRGIYRLNDRLDHYVMKPVAKAYTRALPKPVRKGVTNFFSNIGEVNNAVNDLLQAKLRATGTDVGRFITNTTIGVVGFFDVATRLGLRRNEEDFGQTLAVWGVGDGPYLVIPLHGPSTVRDAPGVLMTSILNGLFFLSASVPIQRTVDAIEAVDRRANSTDELKVVDSTAMDPYVFIREAYRQHREFLIYDGNPPLPDFPGEDLDDGSNLGRGSEISQSSSP